MSVIAKSLGSTVTLNDGVVMPMFGLGAYDLSKGSGGQAESVTSFALKHGYRMVDTAQLYGNETEVGRGVAKSGIPRSEVFVVTKLWDSDHGAQSCKKAFHESLRKLGTDYVDLYLIHSPHGGKNLETYDALLQLKHEDLIRSVGVSNFGIKHLEGLRLAGRPAPSVNQIELHPAMQHEELVKYCVDHNICVMGWSPLAKGMLLKDKTLQEIASRYGRTVAQLAIRWSVQKGYVTIPKSAKHDRVVENADVFDWTISGEDLARMEKLKTVSCDWDPTTSGWDG